jgi:sigma-B regulation protein RsbU (phosphoserine phosphatase)
MDDLDNRACAFEAGATDLISKPLNPREFLGRVRVHLERGRLVERLTEFRRIMSQELEQARQTQELLLPTDRAIAQIEARYPIQVASHYEASIGIGGDFWGIHPLDARQCHVFCTDFSGHGVGAALNTARLHSFISRERASMDDPAAWLAKINRFLCEALPVGQFATMFCGVIDVCDNVLRYAAASSPPPVAFSGNENRRFRPIDGSGYLLGVTWEADYENQTIAFGPDSTLLLYSDALIETPNLLHPVFTSEQLCTFLDARARDLPPADVIRTILRALNSAAPGRPPDDLTIVALKHRIH